MVSGNKHEIETLDSCLRPFDRLHASPVRISSRRSDNWDIGIVIPDLCATFLEHFQEPVAWGLAIVIDIWFVGEANYQDL